MQTGSRRRWSGAWWLAVPALVLGVSGCGSEAPEDAPAAPAASAPAASPPAAAPAAEPGEAAHEAAEEIFATRCVTCHGPEGAGDGPGSAALTPKPRNFQDPDWQASVEDEHIAMIIQYGGAAVGRSPAMPGNPDLTSRPAVVDALVVLIRDLGES